MQAQEINLHGKKYKSAESLKNYVKTLNKALQGTIYEKGSDEYNALRIFAIFDANRETSTRVNDIKYFKIIPSIFKKRSRHHDGNNIEITFIDDTTAVQGLAKARQRFNVKTLRKLIENQ